MLVGQVSTKQRRVDVPPVTTRACVVKDQTLVTASSAQNQGSVSNVACAINVLLLTYLIDLEKYILKKIS